MPAATASASAFSGWLDILPWIALAAGLLAILVVIWLAATIWKASQPPPAEAETLDAVPEPGGGASTLPLHMALSMRQGFRAAMKLLRSHVTGRNPRYQLPWLLMLGDNGTGKTSALDSVRQTMPLGHSLDGAHVQGGGCTWWFFEQGLVLDVTGGLTQSEDGGWRQLLRLLQRYRPRRPLDGIVLTISAADLLDQGDGWNDRIADKAGRWNRRLWQAQKMLGLVAPVYVLVTKCDQVPGFTAFWQHVPPARRGEIFGWSNPLQPETVYSGAWVGEAFAEIASALHSAQVELAADPRIAGDADGMLLFPGEFTALREPLRLFLDAVFQPSGYYEAYPLRGLYFSGRGPEEAPASGYAMGALDDPAASGPSILLHDLFTTKLFREQGLAAPLSRGLIARDRSVLAAQIALGIAVVGLGTGYGFAHARLSREVDNLRPVLRQVAGAMADIRDKERKAHALADGGAVELDFFHEDEALRLLDLMAQVQTHSLTSAFMPTSLFSGINDSMGAFLTHGFDHVILRAMNNQLAQRSRKLLEAADRLPDDNDTDHVTLEAAPEYAQFRDFVAELRSLEKLADMFNGLNDSQDVAALGHLTRSLFNHDLQATMQDRKDLFRQVLKDVRYDRFDIAALRGKATARARNLAWRLYNHLFQSGMIGAELFELTLRLRELQNPAPDLDGESLAVSRALQALQRAEKLLTQPDVQWLGNARFDLGAGFRQSLSDVAASKFFERGLADELASVGQQEFERFQVRLAAHSAPMVGPILSQENGRVQARLAPPLVALKDALIKLLALDYMQPQPKAVVERTIPASTRLIWDEPSLGQALHYFEQYDNFIAEQLPAFPAELRERIRRLSSARLEAAMTAQTARAQHFEAVTPSSVGSEAALAADVRNFRNAAPQIDRLSATFRQLGMTEPMTALEAVSQYQAQTLLYNADLMLQTDRLYLPPRALSGWDGNGSAGFYAFQVGDAVEMQRVLDQERERLLTLFRDYAEPLVSFLSPRGASGMPEDRAVLARWQRIYEEVGKYNARRPDNSLSALERFLRVDLGGASLDKCQGWISLGRPAASGDFFEQRRLELQKSLGERCGQLLADGVLSRYRALGLRFNDVLAGRYPFHNPALGEAFAEVDPEVVRAFFRDNEAEIEALREKLIQQGATTADRKRVLTFLTELSQVGAFMKAVDNEERRTLAATVTVDFRVNRDQERGGNQIIDWAVQLGGRRITPTDQDRSALWKLGDPIAVSLRWAKDAPIQPQQRGPASGLEIKDGTATVSLRNLWSLVRLAEVYGVDEPGAWKRGGEPMLLRFQVPVAPEMPGGGDMAQVFLRLTLTSLDAGQAAKARQIVLPHFPVRAPELAIPRPADQIGVDQVGPLPLTGQRRPMEGQP